MIHIRDRTVISSIVKFFEREEAGRTGVILPRICTSVFIAPNGLTRLRVNMNNF